MMRKCLNVLKNIAMFVIPIASLISTFFIENYLGQSIPEGTFLLILIFAAVIATISIIAVVFMASNLIDGKAEEGSRPFNDICKYDDKVCCSKLTLHSIASNYTLIPENHLTKKVHDEFSLTTLEEIKNIEDAFHQQNGKEIWILSTDLNTEISGGAASIVGTNLTKGVIYRYFYAQTTNNGEDNSLAIENIEILKELYNNSSCVKFYSYSKNNELESFLFDLFGIVIYKYQREARAFFSIRSIKEKNNRIYYEMPKCMVRKYIQMLNKNLT